MINVFVLQNGRLSQVNIETRDDLARAEPIWVDLTDPTDAERDWVRSIYGVTLPDEDEVKDIEASARYYEADSGDLHLRSDRRVFYPHKGACLAIASEPWRTAATLASIG